MDKELVAMAAIQRSIDKLPAAARQRVLAWVAAKAQDSWLAPAPAPVTAPAAPTESVPAAEIAAAPAAAAVAS